MSKNKINKISGRSKKYSENKQVINKLVSDNKGLVSVEQAVKTLFSLNQPNFKTGPSVELHVKLNVDATKTDQIVRGSVDLPHGTGKEVRVAAFVSSSLESEAKQAGADLVGSDDLIEQIKKAEKVNFDKAVADPETMKKLAPIARILGVAGVMPNPKTGTVGTNIAELVKAIKAGKVDFKNDKTGNLHIPCGKINSKFTPEMIIENVKASMETILKNKPEVIKRKFVLKVYLASTQSPSIPVNPLF